MSNIKYQILQIETEVWSVGHLDESGAWLSKSKHKTLALAATRAVKLNGKTSTSFALKSLIQAIKRFSSEEFIGEEFGRAACEDIAARMILDMSSKILDIETETQNGKNKSWMYKLVDQFADEPVRPTNKNQP